MLRFFAPTWVWIMVLCLGNGILIGAAYYAVGKILQEDAKRREASAAVVQACLQSRPQIRRVSKFVQGTNQLALALVENSAAVLDATPKTDPQHEVRQKNLLRIIRARENVKAISSFPVPTRSECRARGS